MAFARALVEALLPGGDGLPSGLDIGIPQRLDEEIWAAPDPLTADLKAALLLIEHGAPAVGAFGRFSSLGIAARQEFLRAILASNVDVFVQVVMAFKQMAHLYYYANEAVWPLIGFDGPWITEAMPAPTSVAYAAVRAAKEGSL